MSGPTSSTDDIDDNITEIQSCNKYSINSFNCEFQNKNDLFIINFNIRSFNSNISEFSTYKFHHGKFKYACIYLGILIKEIQNSKIGLSDVIGSKCRGLAGIFGGYKLISTYA